MLITHICIILIILLLLNKSYINLSNNQSITLICFIGIWVFLQKSPKTTEFQTSTDNPDPSEANMVAIPKNIITSTSTGAKTKFIYNQGLYIYDDLNGFESNPLIEPIHTKVNSSFNKIQLPSEYKNKVSSIYVKSGFKCTLYEEDWHTPLDRVETFKINDVDKEGNEQVIEYKIPYNLDRNGKKVFHIQMDTTKIMSDPRLLNKMKTDPQNFLKVFGNTRWYHEPINKESTFKTRYPHWGEVDDYDYSIQNNIPVFYSKSAFDEQKTEDLKTMKELKDKNFTFKQFLDHQFHKTNDPKYYNDRDGSITGTKGKRLVDRKDSDKKPRHPDGKNNLPTYPPVDMDTSRPYWGGIHGLMTYHSNWTALLTRTSTDNLIRMLRTYKNQLFFGFKAYDPNNHLSGNPLKCSERLVDKSEIELIGFLKANLNAQGEDAAGQSFVVRDKLGKDMIDKKGINQTGHPGEKRAIIDGRQYEYAFDAYAGGRYNKKYSHLHRLDGYTNWWNYKHSAMNKNLPKISTGSIGKLPIKFSLYWEDRADLIKIEYIDPEIKTTNPRYNIRTSGINSSDTHQSLAKIVNVITGDTSTNQYNPSPVQLTPTILPWIYIRIPQIDNDNYNVLIKEIKLDITWRWHGTLEPGISPPVLKLYTGNLLLNNTNGNQSVTQNLTNIVPDAGHSSEIRNNGNYSSEIRNNGNYNDLSYTLSSDQIKDLTFDNIINYILIESNNENNTLAKFTINSINIKQFGFLFDLEHRTDTNNNRISLLDKSIQTINKEASTTANPSYTYFEIPTNYNNLYLSKINELVSTDGLEFLKTTDSGGKSIYVDPIKLDYPLDFNNKLNWTISITFGISCFNANIGSTTPLYIPILSYNSTSILSINATTGMIEFNNLQFLSQVDPTEIPKETTTDEIIGRNSLLLKNIDSATDCSNPLQDQYNTILIYNYTEVDKIYCFELVTINKESDINIYEIDTDDVVIDAGGYEDIDDPDKPETQVNPTSQNTSSNRWFLNYIGGDDKLSMNGIIQKLQLHSLDNPTLHDIVQKHKLGTDDFFNNKTNFKTDIIKHLKTQSQITQI